MYVCVKVSPYIYIYTHTHTCTNMLLSYRNCIYGQASGVPPPPPNGMVW